MELRYSFLWEVALRHGVISALFVRLCGGIKWRNVESGILLLCPASQEERQGMKDKPQVTWHHTPEERKRYVYVRLWMIHLTF